MAACFDLHWVIFRPSKKTDSRLHRFFIKTYYGIPIAHKMCYKGTVEIVEYMCLVAIVNIKILK